MIQAGQMMTLRIGNKFSKSGFTLLETIIVLAIMTLFFAVSIPLFSKFTEKTKLETATRSVASALRTARSYAISNSLDYCVVFDTGTAPDTHFISADGADPIEKRYKLPTGIYFAADSTVTFTPIGMLSGNSTSIDVTDGTNTKTITVEKTTGRVKIEQEE